MTSSANEKPTLNASLFTAYPQFRRVLPAILRNLSSKGGIYVPERVKIRGYGKPHTMVYNVETVAALANIWVTLPFSSMLHFRRARPVAVDINIGNTLSNFNVVGLSIDQDYFHEDGKLEELLNLLKEIYQILHATYGRISSFDTVRWYDSPIGRMSPGMNLRRALPDVEWANFFGPEYVEMFGKEKIESTPCYRVQMLPDGGALLLLTPSALDFISDRKGFDAIRDRIKRHLGEEAFDKGWPEVQGRVPSFRYSDEWRAEFDRWKEDYNRQSSLGKRQDILSNVSRNEWRQWIEDNRKLATSFRTESSINRLSPDFSWEDLQRIDEHLGKTGVLKQPSIDLIMKLAAYVTQIIFAHKQAKWRFEEGDELPSLMIEEVQVIPLSRTLKVLEEGEKFDPWYEAMNRLIVRHSPNKPANS